MKSPDTTHPSPVATDNPEIGTQSSISGIKKPRGTFPPQIVFSPEIGQAEREEALDLLRSLQNKTVVGNLDPLQPAKQVKKEPITEQPAPVVPSTPSAPAPVAPSAPESAPTQASVAESVVDSKLIAFANKYGDSTFRKGFSQQPTKDLLASIAKNIQSNQLTKKQKYIGSGSLLLGAGIGIAATEVIGSISSLTALAASLGLSAGTVAASGIILPASLFGVAGYFGYRYIKNMMAKKAFQKTFGKPVEEVTT